ncbi:MAG: hypothetical protein JWM47_2545 [Acidimicrobiales bacterium]|nr:hypothetical protein [Acidimicrobiales bacterium]
MDLVTLPGVLRPISDSWQLAAALRAEGLGPGRRGLDLELPRRGAAAHGVVAA